MTKEEALQLLDKHFMSIKEVMDYLGISRSALTSLVKREKVTQLEKGGVKLFMREEIEKRKAEQPELQQKFRPYEHKED